MGNARRTALSLGVMLALLALTLYLVFRAYPPAQALAALRTANPLLLLLGLALMTAFLALEALATRLTLHAMGHAHPYRHCLSYSAAGFYFSSITPSASGGQPAQVFYMARRGVPAALGALDMLLLSAAFQSAALLHALWAALTLPHRLEGLSYGLGVLLGYGLTVTALLTLLALLFLFRPGFARRLALALLRLGSKLRLVRDESKARSSLERQLEEYRRGAALLRKKPWLFPALLALSFAQLSCLYLVPWTVSLSFGLTDLPPLDVMGLQALLALSVGALPIPGAAGASEWSFLAAFSGLLPQGCAAPAMLLSRGLSFYLPLVITGVATAALHFSTRAPGTKSFPPEIG